MLQDDVSDTNRPSKSAASTSVLANNKSETNKKPRKKFSRKQLRAGQSFLTQQAATNRFASQEGMTSFGAVRHVSDIKVTELYDECDDDEDEN